MKALAVLQLKTPQGIVPKEWNLNRISTLTDVESEEYFREVQKLRLFELHVKRFGMVFWNYESYCDILQGIFHALITNNQELLNQRPFHIELNRLMQNFLSSITMYLNLTERHLRDQYGADSILLTQFQNDCHQAYDTQFAYRFLYQLRNYAQHYGIPITNQFYSKHFHPTDPNKVVHNFRVSIDRGYLLDTTFHWKKLKAEIESQPEEIDVNTLIEIMMDCLVQIHINNTEREFSALLGSATRIARVVLDKLVGHAGKPLILDDDIIAQIAKNGSGSLDHDEIPIALIEVILSQNFTDFPQRFTRNEPSQTT